MNRHDANRFVLLCAEYLIQGLGMKTQALFAPGDTVKLTPDARKSHRCPKGRRNHRTAVLRNDLSDGGWSMERDLAGCLYWNESDLIVVKRAERQTNRLS